MQRQRHPEHEARHPWLARLLDAYHIFDLSAAEDITRESARRGAPPACGPGCRVCCVGQVIPLSAFEALGLWWHALEMCDEETRPRLRHNLHNHEDSPACPFLVSGVCSAYTLRPLVCRGHHVFGARCKPGENLRQQRPGDVFEAGQDCMRRLAAELFPLYGIADEDVDWRFESGYVGQRSCDIHALPWKNLARRMDGRV